MYRSNWRKRRKLILCNPQISPLCACSSKGFLDLAWKSPSWALQELCEEEKCADGGEVLLKEAG